jgi:hypothetical protein
LYAAMKLRISAWAPLLDTNEINHGLLLPIFVHRVDDQGRPLLGPTRKGPEGKAFMRKAYTVVDAIRRYWMPTAIAETRDHPRRGTSHRSLMSVVKIPNVPDRTRTARVSWVYRAQEGIVPVRRR